MKVKTTREKREEDDTREALDIHQFKKLDLVYQESYNGFLYGIDKSELEDIIKRGKTGLIDLSPGDQVKELIMNPQYELVVYGLLYNNIKDAKTMLEKRAKTSKETKKQTRQRIARAETDQEALQVFEEGYKDQNI